VNVAVFGLGYVGCVSAACLAARGNSVIGIDVSPTKVDALRAGQAPVVEAGLGELVREEVSAGRLRVTLDPAEALAVADICFVCVGTPSSLNGSLGTEALKRVTSTIGEFLRASERRVTVVFRSTMLPGTCVDTLIPLLESSSGRIAGEDFGVAFNPEFLREGSSISDFHNPAKTVIGEFDSASGDVLAQLYEGLPGIQLRVPIHAAEMAKYVDNAFHAVKITFANEVGALCLAYGLDSHVVMESFLVDTKLNISTSYLTPGFAFGGSCLPKDLRALTYAAGRLDVKVPLLESVLLSNAECVRRVVEKVVQLGHRRVGVFGLAFKAGTDDLRESPLVELCERLLGKGFELKIYDGTVTPETLTGTNREYVERHIPHLSRLLTNDPEDVATHGDVCVVGAATPEILGALAQRPGKIIIDLIRLPDAKERRRQEGYIGVAW
jgi:GDP-mannose 6-dehydrogenase